MRAPAGASQPAVPHPQGLMKMNNDFLKQSRTPVKPARIAAVSFIAGPVINRWYVATCPFCSQEHFHGAGRPGENPAANLGTRVSHCRREWNETHGGTYQLIWADGEPSAVM